MSPMPARPKKVSNWPPMAMPRRASSFRPRVITAPRVLSPYAQAVADADGDRDHVLDGRGDLHADHVVVGVDPESRAGDALLPLVPGPAVAGQHDRRRACRARPPRRGSGRAGRRSDGLAGGVVADLLDQHRAQALERVQLETLARQTTGTPGRIAGAVEPAGRRAHDLAGQHDEDGVGAGDRLAEVERRGHVGRQDQVREIVGVGVGLGDRCHLRGLDPPQHDLVPGRGQVAAEARPPAPGAQDRRLHGRSFPFPFCRAVDGLLGARLAGAGCSRGAGRSPTARCRG